MQDTKRIWVWVGIVVVVIGGALAFVWRPNFGNPTTGTGPNSVLQTQSTAQIPSSLLLDGIKAGDITYQTTTPPGTQYTAIINASTSVSALYYSYIQYFLHNGWGFENLPSSTSSSKNIVAMTTSSDITFAITAKGKGSQVTITYAAK